MPHTDPTHGVSLPPSAFAAAFPFHIAIDPDLRLRQAGSSLLRLMPGLVPGAFVPDYFRLPPPHGPLAFDSLCALSGTVVALDATSTPVRLRGQMLHSPEQGCLIFLCTPQETESAAVECPATTASLAVPDEVRPSDENDPSRREAPARPLLVLLAVNDPERLRGATLALERTGGQVHPASAGRLAVDMAAQTRYDLVLLERQLPALDAVEVALAIRNAERLSEDEPVPIVAFTADAADGFCERCLAAGVTHCVSAPLAEHDLAETVGRWADRRPAVLVVDDAPEIRQLVRHRLRDTYRVVQAVDGQQALEQFGRQRVSVVLLDMNMPVLDGYATAAAIRRRADGAGVPIVAVTGNEEFDSRERAAAAGCTMHLMKPVRLATLFSTVEAAMRHTASVLPDAATADVPLPTTAPLVTLEIDPLLADLVPDYVREKRRQLQELRRLITEHEMDRVKRIAHDIKGTGSAYGIPDVTRLGRALETAGQHGDESAAALLVDELDILLSRVQQQLGG